MPGRGMMFVGEKGVQVSAFYGGSPSVSDHNSPQPGQRIQGFPGGWLLPESRFKDFKQPEPYLTRCERPDHYTEWIRACKAGKKSNTPIEFGCDLTEFALLGTATLRRYSTPGRTEEGSVARPGGVFGASGRSDSAVVWIPASNDGHVHDPNARPWRTTARERPTGEVPRFSCGREGREIHQRRRGQRLRGHALSQGVGLQGVGRVVAQPLRLPSPHSCGDSLPAATHASHEWRRPRKRAPHSSVGICWRERLRFARIASRENSNNRADDAGFRHDLDSLSPDDRAAVLETLRHSYGLLRDNPRSFFAKAKRRFRFT